jgi:hypothetical protein
MKPSSPPHHPTPPKTNNPPPEIRGHVMAEGSYTLTISSPDTHALPHDGALTYSFKVRDRRAGLMLGGHVPACSRPNPPPRP